MCLPDGSFSGGFCVEDCVTAPDCEVCATCPPATVCESCAECETCPPLPPPTACLIPECNENKNDGFVVLITLLVLLVPAGIIVGLKKKLEIDKSQRMMEKAGLEVAPSSREIKKRLKRATSGGGDKSREKQMEKEFDFASDDTKPEEDFANPLAGRSSIDNDNDIENDNESSDHEDPWANGHVAQKEQSEKEQSDDA